MALTVERRIELERNLADARKKYHALLTGMSPRVVVDQNAERIEFTAANRQGLYAYIMQLESELGLLTPGQGTPSAPARFYF